jgi:hypothetical protein
MRHTLIRPGVDRGVRVDEGGLAGGGILRHLEEVEQLAIGSAGRTLQADATDSDSACC